MIKLKVSFNEVDSYILTKFIQTKCIFNTNFGEIFQIRIDDKYEGNCNSQSLSTNFGNYLCEVSL